MNAAQLINQTSGKTEYYTPVEIIEAARKVMGGIDLDPASSETANKIVRAKEFYTESDNGLLQAWSGNIWLNHPFSRESNPLWIDMLIAKYKFGSVKQACCITYACTSERWFRPLYNYPMCFLSPRTNYRLPDGSILKGVTKGSVVTYMGPYTYSFEHQFEKLGAVMLPSSLNGKAPQL